MSLRSVPVTAMASSRRLRAAGRPRDRVPRPMNLIADVNVPDVSGRRQRRGPSSAIRCSAPRTRACSPAAPASWPTSRSTARSTRCSSDPTWPTASCEAVHTAAAAECDGVHSVWTAADLDLPDQRAFSGDEALGRPLLAVDRVRFVGEAVAVVLAGHAGPGARRRRGRDASRSTRFPRSPTRSRPPTTARRCSFPAHGTNLVGPVCRRARRRLLRRRRRRGARAREAPAGRARHDGGERLRRGARGRRLAHGVGVDAVGVRCAGARSRARSGSTPTQVRVRGAVDRRRLRRQGRRVPGTTRGRRRSRTRSAARCDGPRAGARTCSA